MGRKGGGKKAFLKGVVAKPDTEDTPAQPLGQAESSSVAPETASDDQPQAAIAQHVPQSTTQNGVPATDHTLTEAELESEKRGQLTQRHKKVFECSVVTLCTFLETSMFLSA